MKSRWNWLTRVASHTVKEGTAALRGMICLLQCHLLQRGWHIRVPCANSLCSQGREMGHNSSDPKAAILDSTCKASVREDRGLVCEGTLTAEGCWWHTWILHLTSNCPTRLWSLWPKAAPGYHQVQPKQCLCKMDTARYLGTLFVKCLLENIPEIVLKNAALKKWTSENFDALRAEMRKIKELEKVFQSSIFITTATVIARGSLIKMPMSNGFCK